MSENNIGAFHATGKKKTSVASVTISATKKGSFVVNGREAKSYLQEQENYLTIALSPFAAAGIEVSSFNIFVKAFGGGVMSQAFAIRHGIAKALASMLPEKRKHIKKLGFLTRDARVVERKKPGLRKARRKEQFSKR